MRKAVLLLVVLAIAAAALAFFCTGSGAEEARNINVSLGSTAIRTGDTLTVAYTMQRDYPAGQLYIRDRNTNDQLYYQACPGSAGTRSVAWPCTAPEGSYYVIVFGVVNDSYSEADACGFTVDNSPPSTAASAPGGSGWRRNTVTLTARDTLSGVAGLYYSRDNATWQQSISPDTCRVILPGGTQTLYFYSVDRSGNREPNRSVTYNIDDQPPVTGALLSGTQGKNGWFTSDVQVTLGATDNASGVATTYYLLDGEEYTYSGPITLDTGSYWLTYWSRDNAGNVESPHDLTICVDTAPPATTATPPGNTGRYTGNVVTLSAAGASGIGGLYYSFDGSGWLSCGSSDPGVGYVILPEGNHTLYYRAEGNNGLMETPHSAAYCVDTRKPTITATLAGQKGDNGWYNSSVQVTLSAADNDSGVAGISYVLDGSTQNYSGPFTAGDGSHSLTFRATDNAGNANASGLDGIRIDSTPPRVSCVLSGETNGQGSYLSDVQVTLQTSDDLSGVNHTWYSTDGTAWAGYTGPFIVPKGDQTTVRYRCTDNAGNTASGSQIVSFATAGGNGNGNDNGNGQGSGTTGSGSTPAPTTGAPVYTTATPKPSPKPSGYPTATPVPTPSPRPTVPLAQESTGLSCCLLPLAILVLAAIVAGVYLLFTRKKGGKRAKRL